MPSSLDITFRVLSSTANETSTTLLVRLLDVSDRTIRDRALRAILLRRSHEAHREVLHRWQQFDEASKSIIQERPGRMTTAIREAIFSNHRNSCIAGCEAALRAREYDLIPVLVNAAEDRTNLQADTCSQTLLSLAEMLNEEVNAPRDYSQRFDPQLIRQYVTNSLEQSVRRFDLHKRREIVEAFLLLTNHDNPTLERILQDTSDKCYITAIDCLAHGTRPGIIRLLCEFMNDARASAPVLTVISRRRDRPFLRRLLEVVGGNPSAAAQHNLKKLDAVRWLRDDLSALDDLAENEQSAALAVAKHSNMKRLQVFEVVRHILIHGKTQARRDAAAALDEFRGAESNDLLLKALTDQDPIVLARLTIQLRERGIPGAMSKLIEFLDSPHEPVREAARAGLSEYNFQRYLSSFDMLDDELRRNTGQLVKKVDADAIPALNKELRAPSRTRRMRALESAIAMDAVADVEPAILYLMTETDQFIRAQAARTLGYSDTFQSRRALRQALLDPNICVREEAENALQQMMDRMYSDAVTTELPVPTISGSPTTPISPWPNTPDAAPELTP